MILLHTLPLIATYKFKKMRKESSRQSSSLPFVSSFMFFMSNKVEFKISRKIKYNKKIDLCGFVPK